MNIKFNLLAVLVVTFATVALQTSSVAGGLRGIDTPRIDPTVRVDTSMKLDSPSFRAEVPISARQADVTQKIINDINPTSPSVTMAKPVSKAPDFIGSSNGARKNGETAATKAGRQAHKDWDAGKGFEKEVTLPSGKRADAVNFTQNHVKELKPDNPRAIKRGELQVEQYRRELAKEYGGNWRSSVETYK